MARNPRAKPYRVLGYTKPRWDALLATVTAYLEAHDDEVEIPEAVLRKLDPALAQDLTWNQVAAELGL